MALMAIITGIALLALIAPGIPRTYARTHARTHARTPIGTPRTRARTRARTLARNSQDSCSPCLGCLGCHASDAMGGGAVSCGPASASCASYAWPRHEAAIRDYELLRIFKPCYEFI